MSNFAETKSDFDLTNILFFFIKWWKHFAVIILAAIIASVVFSSPRFITPKYEASVVLMPAPVQSLSGAIFADNNQIFRYGGLTDAENLLQVLGSASVRERVANRFNLYEHYEIAHDSPYRETELKLHYGSNISAQRTTFGAVAIRVKDKDPEMAAAIANYISMVVDTVKNELRGERALIAHNIALYRYASIRRELALAQDSLNILMQRGLYHYELQSDRFSQQLAIAVAAGNQQGIRNIENRIDVIQDYGSEFISRRNHLDNVSRSLADAQIVVQNTRVDLEEFIRYTYLLDDAVVPEKDVYPVRWLIVFFTVFGAGLMSLVVLIAYEIFVKRGIIKQKVN